MVKRDPDDIISALSKNLKCQSPQILRITLKRALPAFSTKIIPKKQWRLKKKQMQTLINEKGQETWPLYVRYKESVEGKENAENKDERLRLNCPVKEGKANAFMGSIMSTFRVNFYKKHEVEKEKKAKEATKKNPNSNSSKKKVDKNIRNRERRNKRKQIKKQEKARVKQQEKKKRNNEEATN